MLKRPARFAGQDASRSIFSPPPKFLWFSHLLQLYLCSKKTNSLVSTAGVKSLFRQNGFRNMCIRLMRARAAYDPAVISKFGTMCPTTLSGFGCIGAHYAAEDLQRPELPASRGESCQSELVCSTLIPAGYSASSGATSLVSG